MTEPLYHLVPKDSWIEHQQSRKPYFPPTYDQDGFIHLTKDPNFLLGVANNFYSSKDPWEWICLRIDPSRLTSEVRYEPAAPVGNTAPPTGWKEGALEAPVFPHLYGTIDFDAVTAEHAVRRDSQQGTFLNIEGVT
ncbi:g3123 [Coccomyxa elongata]